MPVINDSLFTVSLPSGNRAIYSVQPHHLIDRPDSTLAERARMYGKQIAVEFNGRWHETGNKNEITDLKTLALLDRVPNA